MQDDWLDAVRVSLPSEGPAPSSARLAVTHLDPASVRPQRTPDGGWTVTHDGAELAALPNDDAFLDRLGVEWAGPVELTTPEDRERLFLFGGHWLLVEIPEDADRDALQPGLSQALID